MFDFPARPHADPLDPPRDLPIRPNGSASHSLIARLPPGVASAKLASFMELEGAVLAYCRPRQLVLHCGDEAWRPSHGAQTLPVEIVLRIGGRLPGARGELRLDVLLRPRSREASEECLKKRYRAVLHSLRIALLAADVERRAESRLRTVFPVRVWPLETADGLPDGSPPWIVGHGSDVCSGGMGLVTSKAISAPYVFVEFNVPATRRHQATRAVVVSRGSAPDGSCRHHLAFEAS